MCRLWPNGGPAHTQTYTTSMIFPQLAIKVAASMSAAVMDMQLRILRQQSALFSHMYAERRADDPHVTAVNPETKKRKTAKHVSPCCGPDLLDHYGKRARDVDVEHI